MAFLSISIAVWGPLPAQVWADLPDDKTRICIMNADGSDLKPLARIEPYTRHEQPRLSPDGKQVVFGVSWKPGGVYDPRIFKVATDGSQPTDLGPGKTPSWSPDGKQILFRIPPDAGLDMTDGVWVMNADGEGRQHLLPGFLPCFSPEGGRVVCTSSHEGADNIYIYDVLEATSRKINPGYPKILGYPSWSPDGAQICFIGKKDSGECDLVLADIQGSQSPKVRFTSTDLSQQSPAWGPNDKILVGMRVSGELHHPFVIDPRTQDDPKELEHLDENQEYRDASWSTDGKKIVAVTGHER
jgi:Tol biopolymer transport system component